MGSLPKLLGIAAVMCGLLLGSSSVAMAQKKANNKKPDASPATDAQYKLLSQYKEMVGVIESATVNTDGSTIVLRVEYDHPNPNGNAKPNTNTNKNANTAVNRTVANANRAQNAAMNRGAQMSAADARRIEQQLVKLQRDEAALRTAKNPAQLQQKLQQLARDQQTLQRDLYQYQMHQTQIQQQEMMAAMRLQNAQTNKAVKQAGNAKSNANGLVKDYIDFELPLTEKAAVRKMNVGIEYDDKGNVKESDPAAKKDGLPGFAAKIEDLLPGAKAKIYLSPAKAPAASAPKKDADGGILAAGPSAANRPQVRMVVMLSDGGLPALGANNKKKNK